MTITLNNPVQDGCENKDRCRFVDDGPQTVTLAWYQPVYDSNGVNINPDRNIRSASTRRCLTCGKTMSSAP